MITQKRLLGDPIRAVQYIGLAKRLLASVQHDFIPTTKIMPDGTRIVVRRFPWGIGQIFINAPAIANIYIADTGGNRIVVVDSLGQPINTFGYGGAGGSSDEGLFHDPWGIQIYKGVVYVTDAANQRIQMFTKDGVFISSTDLGYFPTDLAVSNNRVVITAPAFNTRMGFYVYDLNMDLVFEKTRASAPGTITETDDFFYSFIFAVEIGAGKIFVSGNIHPTASNFDAVIKVFDLETGTRLFTYNRNTSDPSEISGAGPPEHMQFYEGQLYFIDLPLDVPVVKVYNIAEATLEYTSGFGDSGPDIQTVEALEATPEDAFFALWGFSCPSGGSNHNTFGPRAMTVSRTGVVVAESGLDPESVCQPSGGPVIPNADRIKAFALGGTFRYNALTTGSGTTQFQRAYGMDITDRLDDKV